jgi:hypothetical protein
MIPNSNSNTNIPIHYIYIMHLWTSFIRLLGYSVLQPNNTYVHRKATWKIERGEVGVCWVGGRRQVGSGGRRASVEVEIPVPSSSPPSLSF